MLSILNSDKFYRRSIRTSFFLVLFLVFVGGLVRSTGSGMGCPDWPKCFGRWVPPTVASEVPLSYWTNPLSSKDGKLIFNVWKTWTEYLNRLLGVVIGFAILIQAFASLKFGSFRAKIFSFLALLLVLFQGWLGSKVVSTDLLPIIITLHLLVALLISGSLLFALRFAQVPSSSFKKDSRLIFLTWLGLGLLSIQFFLGTGVRSQIDILFKAFDYGQRDTYLDQLNWIFWIHRSFSILLLGWLAFQVFLLGPSLPISQFGFITLPLILALVLVFSGVILTYFDFPSFVQPFHLLFGYSIVCSQVWLLVLLYPHASRKNTIQ